MDKEQLSTFDRDIYKNLQNEVYKMNWTCYFSRASFSIFT
jgi:hypothetical protein